MACVAPVYGAAESLNESGVKVITGSYSMFIHNSTKEKCVSTSAGYIATQIFPSACNSASVYITLKTLKA